MAEISINIKCILLSSLDCQQQSVDDINLVDQQLWSNIKNKNTEMYAEIRLER